MASDAAPGFEEILAELTQDNDRAAAVVGAAYLDERLAELLRTKMVTDIPMIRELFEQSNALSTFSARISVAYGCGLIARNAAYDLHLVRRIRNDFAHRLHGISFENPEMRSRVDEFRILKSARFAGMTTRERGFSTRHRFTANISLLVLFGVEVGFVEAKQFTEARDGAQPRPRRAE